MRVQTHIPESPAAFEMDHHLQNPGHPPAERPAFMHQSRLAQQKWRLTAMEDRLGVIRHFRHSLAQNALSFASAAGSLRNRPAAESVTSEVLPLADACRFLENHASAILMPKKLRRRGRPLWLQRAHSIILREPLGVILIIGPSNYPLFLPGIQILQALTAGNAVVFKPGLGGTAAARQLQSVLISSGLNPHLLHLLPEAASSVYPVISAGVDKVVLTGSGETGRQVARAAAEALVPVTAELSGCDAVYIRNDADLDLVKNAIRFGCDLNGGNTCIAPKRIIASAHILAELRPLFPSLEFLQADSDQEAVAWINNAPLALGASLFSRDPAAARNVAAGINTGVVVINDMIVPTADPRLPFGGRRQSGYGVTRGAEGLLEMTAPKVVISRGGNWRPHFEPAQPGDEMIFAHYLQAVHGGGWKKQCAAFVHLIQQLGKRHAANK
jgi:acyl-CoA reductase-like NAD-dependent aldehyde dehydrogenase